MRLRWAVLGLIAAGAPAFAGDAPSWTWRPAIDAIGALRWAAPARGALNPGNRLLGVPRWEGLLDVRANLRLERSTDWQVVLRPRGLVTWSRADADGTSATTHHLATASWTEGFVTWRPADWIAVTAGRQHYQWGPGELLSPSNRLVRESGLMRDPLYLVRGKDMLRINLSHGKSWTAVVLADLHDSGDGAAGWDEHYRRHAALKLEYASEDGGAYAGVAAGKARGDRAWWGEYASWSISDAWAVYVDASHRRGSRAWYPVDGPYGPHFARALEHDGGLRTLALGGVRFSAARGDELRVEYLLNDAGWDQADFDRSAAALALTRRPGPLLDPGLEFAGRRFVLLSWRGPDLPPAKKTTVAVRYLHSLTDRSGVLFATASLEAADALVVFASLTATRGADTAEFSRFVRTSALAGAVYTW